MSRPANPYLSICIVFFVALVLAVPLQAYQENRPQGLTHVSGQTLTIPAGESYTFSADLDDHVLCYGSLSEREGGTLNLLGGVEVRDSGMVELTDGRVVIDDIVSGIDGQARLTAHEMIVGSVRPGPRRFTQDGGEVSLSQYLRLGETTRGEYVMNAGRLSVRTMDVGYDSYGLFQQYGGEVSVEDNVAIAWRDRFRSRYELHDGLLECGNMAIGDAGGSGFVQYGGVVHSVPDDGKETHGSVVLDSQYHEDPAIYEMRGGTLLAGALNQPYYGHGQFHQYGGTVEIYREYGMELGGEDEDDGYYLHDGRLSAERLEFEYGGYFRQESGEALFGEIEMRGRAQYDYAAKLHVLGGTFAAKRFVCSDYNAADVIFGGGVAEANVIDLGAASRLKFGGGTLRINAGLNVDGRVVFTGGGRLENRGIVDLGGAASTEVLVADTVLSTTPGSLTVLPAGTSAEDLFARVGGDGLIATHGEGVTISAGRRIEGAGDLQEPIDCQGALDATPGYRIDLRGPLTVGARGRADLGHASTAVLTGESRIEGGRLKTQYVVVEDEGAGRVLQTGGEVVLRTDRETPPASLWIMPRSGGVASYELHDGTIAGSEADLIVGTLHRDEPADGEARFVQHGGEVDVDSVYISRQPGNDSVFEIHGGSLRATSRIEGGSYMHSVTYTQTGGEVFTPDLRLSDADIRLEGGLARWDQATLFTRVSYTQTGGTLESHRIDINDGSMTLHDGTIDTAFLALRCDAQQHGGTIEARAGMGLSGGAAYRKSAGRIDAKDLHLSDGAQFVQEEGSLSIGDRINVSQSSSFRQVNGRTTARGVGVGENSSFVLESGELTLIETDRGPWISGSGLFRQLGGSTLWEGTLNITTRDSNTHYCDGGVMAGPAIFLGDNNFTGRFEQTGGAIETTDLKIEHQGSYRLSGGTFTVDGPRLLVRGRFEFPGDGGELIVPDMGIVDFARGELAGEGGGSIVAGPRSLILHNPGQRPSQVVGRFETEGLVHEVGGVLEIPAGRTVIGWGEIDDPVVCHGLIEAPAGGKISIYGTVDVRQGGRMGLGDSTLSANSQTYDVAGSLTVRKLNVLSDSALRLHGGSVETGVLWMARHFNVTPRLSVDDPSSRLVVRERFGIGGGARIDAAPGSSILFDGADFEMVNRLSPDSDLGEIGFVFAGGTEDDPLTFEVGDSPFWVNETEADGYLPLDSLTVGEGSVSGHLRLVDLFDNIASTGDGESLVVRSLTLNPGSTLDLNGLDLYVNDFRDLGGTLLNPESLIVYHLPVMGDFNGDGAFSGLDIPALKTALFLGATQFEWETGIDANRIGDFNGDGRFTGLDIPGFKAALAEGASTVPEPATLFLMAVGCTLVRRRRRA